MPCKCRRFSNSSEHISLQAFPVHHIGVGWLASEVRTNNVVFCPLGPCMINAISEGCCVIFRGVNVICEKWYGNLPMSCKCQ